MKMATMLMMELLKMLEMFPKNLASPTYGSMISKSSPFRVSKSKSDLTNVEPQTSTNNNRSEALVIIFEDAINNAPSTV